jgi:hypothetical protein
MTTRRVDPVTVRIVFLLTVAVPQCRAAHTVSRRRRLAMLAANLMTRRAKTSWSARTTSSRIAP